MCEFFSRYWFVTSYYFLLTLNSLPKITISIASLKHGNIFKNGLCCRRNKEQFTLYCLVHQESKNLHCNMICVYWCTVCYVIANMRYRYINNSHLYPIFSTNNSRQDDCNKSSWSCSQRSVNPGIRLAQDLMTSMDETKLS